jgi:hypothetical protein
MPCRADTHTGAVAEIQNTLHGRHEPKEADFTPEAET